MIPPEPIPVGARAALEAAERAIHEPIGTEHALLQAAGRGDAEAFAELYRRYAPMVHAVIVASGQTRDAEDLTQETFLTAMKSMGRLREPEAFGGWLAAIARNEARQAGRGLRRALLRALGLARPRSAPIADRAAEIVEVMSTLPEAYRETVAMRVIAGMKGEEIAARTGLTHDSVRVNLSRGMTMLRERLNDEQTRRQGEGERR
ncbi:MAG: RNA polymerase sigma factor [Phycisphaerales bacterium]